MRIGDRIKELRTKLGLSQSELGNRIDTDGSVISRWETNRARVSQRYIVKLAKALGTSTDYLLGETNEPDLQKNVSSNKNFDNAHFDGLNENHEKRLIIKKGDLYINLPETSEGFRALDKLLDSRIVENFAMAK